MQRNKRLMKKNVWSRKSYYHLIEDQKISRTQPGMEYLCALVKRSEKVLDMGCGEGSRLNFILGDKKKGVGVDISESAVKLARKKHAKIKFIQADLEKLPFKDKTFDLVYSAYVLEHLSNPKKVIDEAIRVLKQNGHLILIAPNFGAPNRASPPYKGNRLVKLFAGFVSDLFILFLKMDHLGWKKVNPIATEREYKIDWDTLVEPYINSLLKYLNAKRLNIIYQGTSWKEEQSYAKTQQKIFKVLAKYKIYPFNMWGPCIVVVAQKIGIIINGPSITKI